MLPMDRRAALVRTAVGGRAGRVLGLHHQIRHSDCLYPSRLLFLIITRLLLLIFKLQATASLYRSGCCTGSRGCGRSSGTTIGATSPTAARRATCTASSPAGRTYPTASCTPPASPTTPCSRPPACTAWTPRGCASSTPSPVPSDHAPPSHPLTHLTYPGESHHRTPKAIRYVLHGCCEAQSCLRLLMHPPAPALTPTQSSPILQFMILPD